MHYRTTGPEIWAATQGHVDVLVSAFGTGGTLSGTGRFLKERNPDLHIVAVEPAESPLLSSGRAGPHKIQGIGANFLPDTLDRSIIDEVLTISSAKAARPPANSARRRHPWRHFHRRERGSCRCAGQSPGVERSHDRDLLLRFR